MALGAITKTHDFVIGDRRATISTVVLSASYTTGGDAVTGATFGLPGNRLDALLFANTNGYQLRLNAGKVMAYTSAGTETTSTTDLSGITATVIAIGK